jgi:hypothetical protein
MHKNNIYLAALLVLPLFGMDNETVVEDPIEGPGYEIIDIKDFNYEIPKSTKN